MGEKCVPKVPASGAVVDRIVGEKKMITASVDKYAALSARVAAMSLEQREVRGLELAFADPTPETFQEFIKLILGPDASIAEE